MNNLPIELSEYILSFIVTITNSSDNNIKNIKYVDRLRYKQTNYLEIKTSLFFDSNLTYEENNEYKHYNRLDLLNFANNASMLKTQSEIVDYSDFDIASLDIDKQTGEVGYDYFSSGSFENESWKTFIHYYPKYYSINLNITKLKSLDLNTLPKYNPKLNTNIPNWIINHISSKCKQSYQILITTYQPEDDIYKKIHKSYECETNNIHWVMKTFNIKLIRMATELIVKSNNSDLQPDEIFYHN